MIAWQPGQAASEAIRQFVSDLLSLSPELMGTTEIISGCVVTDVPAGPSPKYVSARINRYNQDVMWRGIPDGIARGDIVHVIHFREGNRYEILSPGGATGTAVPGGLAAEVLDWIGW